MKLSVYVPDDIWERANHLRPKSHPSAIVQEGLARLLNESFLPRVRDPHVKTKATRMVEKLARLEVRIDRLEKLMRGDEEDEEE